jgi:hypothetical protein
LNWGSGIRGQAENLFGCLVRVRQDHQVRGRRARQGLDEQPLSRQAVEDRPTHLVDAIARRLGHQCRVLVIAEPLEARRHPAIDEADDLGEARAILRERLVPCGGR